MARRIVVTPEQIAEATRLYLEEGLSMYAIGQLVGMSDNAVSRNLLVGVPRRRPGMRAGTMLTTYAEKAERLICPTCGIVTDDGQECDGCAGRVVPVVMPPPRVVEPLAGIVWTGTFLTMHNEAYLGEASGW